MQNDATPPAAPHAPPSLLHQLNRSLLWVGAAMLLLTTLALGWFAQRNIGKESSLVPTVDRLYALLQAPSHDSPAALLTAVQALARHPDTDKLRLRLQDDQGQTVFDTGTDTTPTWLQRPEDDRAAWTHTLIIKGVAAPWRLTVSANPRNEWDEAKDNLQVALGAVLVLTAVLYAAIGWRLRQAFAPLDTITEHLRLLERSVQDTNPLPPIESRELGQIARSINHLQAELVQQQNQRQLLMNRLQDLQETERRRIAHELHDEWGQHLTALQVDAATLVKLTQQDPASHATARALLDNAQTLLRQLRDLLQQLRPAGLDGDDDQTRALAHSLQTLVDQWSQRLAGKTHIVLQLALPDFNLPSRLSLACYRIAQEAMTNAARHADASQIEMAVEHDAEHATLVLTISDNGKGLASEHQRLPRSLRERVHAEAGHLDILQNLPSGWKLIATLPLHTDHHEPDPARQRNSS